jgi:hypothetical protein
MCPPTPQMCRAPLTFFSVSLLVRCSCRMKYNILVELALLFERIDVTFTDYLGQAFRKRLEHQVMQLRQEPESSIPSDMLRIAGILKIYADATLPVGSGL